ncbi:HesA/MoeB/ThiF family protein [Sphingomonas sp. NCPPB 2930]
MIPNYLFDDLQRDDVALEIINGWSIEKTSQQIFLYHESFGVLRFLKNTPEFDFLALYNGGNLDISKIKQTLGMKCSRTLVKLWEKGIIKIKEKESDRQLIGNDIIIRFEWLLEYLSRFAGSNLSSFAMLSNLQKSRVCVVGLGALGATLALSLSASGVGTIRLVDGDTVSISNLSRQILYGESDVGIFKTSALQRVINKNNSSVIVEKYDYFIESQSDAEKYIKESSFVILCADQPRLKIRGWVGKACLDLRIPLLTMSGQWVGPVQAYDSPCFACLGRKHASTIADTRGMLSRVYDDQPPPRGSFGPRPLTTAGLMSSVVLNFLTCIDQYSFLTKRLRIGIFGEFEEENIIRYRDCPACKIIE